MIYEKLKKQLESQYPDCKIIAVSKMQSVEKMMNLYNKGHRDFAENYVQELLTKQAQLPHDVQWHFIGKLQTNKIKTIVGKVALIHSVDTLKVALEINKWAEKLRLIQKRAQSLIEQGYDFLVTNKDLFYSDLKNKFFLRMNEAGKANFLLGNEEKIQRHYMSATYANKLLRNEDVSEDLKERYLTKRLYNTYYIGYPMLEMSGLTEKIHYVQDTYDRLECSKFLNKQLNF